MLLSNRGRQPIVAQAHARPAALCEEVDLHRAGAWRQWTAVALPAPGEDDLAVWRQAHILATHDVPLTQDQAIDAAWARIKGRVQTLPAQHFHWIGEIDIDRLWRRGDVNL